MDFEASVWRKVANMASSRLNGPQWQWLVVLAMILSLFVLLAIATALRMRKPASVIGSAGVQMVLVPAGPFTMGSEAGVALAECRRTSSADRCVISAFQDEAPTHIVMLDDFYIDMYEVTNGQYAECVRAGECYPPSDSGSHTRESYFGNPQFDDYPVILVNWYDAERHCRWRGAHLPTEAEWEKAARGTDARLYPWGNAVDGNRANFCDRNCAYDWAGVDYDDGYADTAPVGSYSEGISPYGAYDMAGNVWEWVSDWYDADYYAGSPSENPAGPGSGEYRVVRGAAWFSQPSSVRAAYRIANVPTGRYHLVGGFRCARSP